MNICKICYRKLQSFCIHIECVVCQVKYRAKCVNMDKTDTVYPKKYAHGFCFAMLCCGYTLTDFPISIRLTSLALWQSNDCPSASKATLMNMDKYFMWIHYERLHNHNKAKHNKTVCIFLGIYWYIETWYVVLSHLFCVNTSIQSSWQWWWLQKCHNGRNVKWWISNKWHKQ